MFDRPAPCPAPVAFAERSPTTRPTQAISWSSAPGPGVHGLLAPAGSVGPAARPPGSPARTACYMGHGALSVRSSVTGRHYRFMGHGDTQPVDRHDLPMLRRIADLMIR